MLGTNKTLVTLFATLIAILGSSSQAGEVKVLFLGGSHSLGVFGEELDTDLRRSGVKLTSVIDGGAGPYHWLSSYQSFPCAQGYWYKDSTTEKRVASERTVPKLKNLIETEAPTHVLIQTEWNLYSTLRSPRREKKDNVAEVRFLIAQMCKVIQDSGAEAYWVLPPDAHEKRYSRELQDELAAIMIEVISEYNFDYTKSASITRYTEQYPVNDGVTLSSQQYKSWAQAVARDLVRNVGEQNLQKIPIVKAKPVLLSKPKSGSAPQLNPLGEIVEELTAKN